MDFYFSMLLPASRVPISAKPSAKPMHWFKLHCENSTSERSEVVGNQVQSYPSVGPPANRRWEKNPNPFPKDLKGSGSKPPGLWISMVSDLPRKKRSGGSDPKTKVAKPSGLQVFLGLRLADTPNMRETGHIPELEL